MSISNKVSTLTQYKRYLETSPDEKYLQSELDKLLSRLELINDQYSDWLGRREDCRSLKSEYNKLMGVSSIKKRISTLKYLLK